ncbi:hypothetical protein SAMN05428941_6693 [Streptomyces sp. 2114.2]|nr:hypothetical protein BX268_6706 [Streptomyces sp. 2221.1]SDT79353.1 hypothetical protein SAMN05428941_6693 [Streptomyces sp. 2114.2]
MPLRPPPPQRRMSVPTAWTAVVVVTAVVATSATACSGQDSAVPDSTVAPPTASPAPGEVVLPVNTYLPTVHDQTRTALARAVLIDRCMQKSGFSFPRPADSVLKAGVKDNGVYGNKRRYGVADTATARRYGYHLPSAVDEGADKDTEAAAQRADWIRAQRSNPAYTASLNGGGENGPPGGCVAEADAALAGEDDASRDSYTEVASDIKAESHKRTMSSPHVVTVFKQWSHCMHDKGYTTAAPVGENLPFNIDVLPVSREEINMALADVACKRETRLVTIWSREEQRYQKAQIKKHADELRKAADDNERRRESIASIVGHE